MLKEIIAVIFRWKWEIIAVAGIIIVLTAAYVFIAQPVYESKAMVLVLPGRDKRPFIPDQNSSNIQTYFQVNLEDIANEIQIMKSDPVLKAVIDKVSPLAESGKKTSFLTRWMAGIIASVKKNLVAAGLKHPDPSAEETAITALDRGLRVDFIKRTAVITIAFRAKTPELAQQVVNAVVDAYIAHHLKVFSNTGAATAMRFIGRDFQGQLREKEDSLNEFKTRKGVVDAELEYQDIQKKLTDAKSKLLVLEKINVDHISTADLAQLSDDPAFSQLQARLTDAELRYVELSSRYGKNEGKVIATAKEIDEIKQFIGKRISVSIETWNRLSTQFQDRFENLERSSVRIKRLEREIQAVKDAVQISAQKSNEMTINAYLDTASISSVRIVQYGSASTLPIFPKRMKSILMALFLGPFFGGIYGIVRNRASSSLFTIGDVESVSRIPVVTSIQEIAPQTGLIADEPITAAARILGPVVNTIRALPADSLTLVTSPSAGCGTSFIAAAIALSLSSDEKGRSLRIEILPFDAGGKKEPYVEFTSSENMATYDIRGRIIAGSKRRPDLLRVAAAPDADIIAQFIRRIKDLGYSRPILDISAHHADPLYLSFAGHASALYVVAAYGKTNRYSLARMMNLLDRLGHKVNGCIFNRRVNVIPEFLYQWL